MRPGTPEHRDLFCRTFIDSHVAFEPEALPWPELDQFYLERLHAFPLWSYARAIEQRAGRMVSAFARTLDDPLIREAVAVQGIEETRHGHLMTHVMERYGVNVPSLPPPDLPSGREDFLVFGFGECTDSFVGFGAFSLARQKKLFPDPLMKIFDNVLWEEARHIVFFINWWRYEEARAGRGGLFHLAYNSPKYHLKSMMRTAEGGEGVPTFPVLGRDQIRSVTEGITPMMFLEAALAENRRHMDRFDRRLIKPVLMPRLAMVVLAGLRMLPPRTAPSSAAANGVQESIRPRSAA
jgi:hypothetical protein